MNFSRRQLGVADCLSETRSNTCSDYSTEACQWHRYRQRYGYHWEWSNNFSPDPTEGWADITPGTRRRMTGQEADGKVHTWRSKSGKMLFVWEIRWMWQLPWPESCMYPLWLCVHLPAIGEVWQIPSAASAAFSEIWSWESSVAYPWRPKSALWRSDNSWV